MQRKVIKQSQTTLGITLPSKWAKKWYLKKGDTLNIEDNEGVLEIRPENFSIPEKKAEFDAHLYPGVSKIVFNNLSKRGYDQIKVFYKDEKEIEPIKQTLQYEATMFEIIKKEDWYITAKAISEANISEIKIMMNRVIMLLIEKINKFEEYLKTENHALLKDILELERSNTKQAHICMRAIHKHPQEVGSYMRYIFFWHIKQLGYAFRMFARLGPKNIRPETKKVLSEVFENIRMITDIYFRYSPQKASELFQRKVKSEKDCMKLLKSKNNVEDHPLLHLALSMTEKTYYILFVIFAFQKLDVV